MRMCVVCLVLLAFPVRASAGSGVFGDRDLVPAPPSVLGGSAGAWMNPAAWALQDRAELAFYWTDQDVSPHRMDHWGLSLGRELGFSVESATHAGDGNPRTYAYQLGTAWGSPAAAFGMSWRWSGGNRAWQSPGGLGLGVVGRPNRHLSWGLSGLLEGLTDPQGGMADVGVRPLGKPWLTAFADYTVTGSQKLGDGQLGFGMEVRPAPGVHLGFRAWDDPEADALQSSITLGVTLDGLGLHTQPQYRKANGDSRHAYTSYLVRANPPHSGLPLRKTVKALKPPHTVGVLDLERRFITYDRNTFFSSERKSWLDLSRQLDAAEADPSLKAVAINVSGASMRPSLGWELRERILKLRASGKQVYVHSDNYSMGKYYVASAADSVSLDPMGILRLPGLAFHRTYWAGLLDKLGIGAEEWRLFTHKTAFQTYVRKDMSEADREQIGRLADVIYETWRAGICRERKFTPEAFDALVDDDVLFSADQAQARGLVDRAGTWAELRRRVRKAGETWAALPEADTRLYPDDQWGPIPEIAVVYAVGACAMDSGINGRKTSKYVDRLAGKKNVRGVVLRVDSPGGDPLPCELINRAVHSVQDKDKPVIVSQGDVAASGGYYLSMPADTILATPLTVTGSIGVIFGWMWDDGFSQKSGFSADGVQRGKSADLFTGIKVPFIPVKLPERNLTPEELETAKAFIRHEYDLFVGAVARERGLEEEHVRRVAEGHVWMAEDALQYRLIDGIGGLDDAIEQARIKAGLKEDDVYVVTEYPPHSFFELPALGLGVNQVGKALWPGDAGEAAPETDYETEYFKLLFGVPGQPMFLLPPGSLPEDWISKERQ